jgi:carbon monoxide dehydrogenase subunit G
MAVEFGGVFEVEKKAEDVYDVLTDPKQFAALLKNSENLVVQDDTHFTFNLNTGVSYIATTAVVEVELSEADRPRRARYKGHGSAAGENATMAAGFDLTPTTYGTRVDWRGEAQIVGRFASIADIVIEPLIKKQTQKWIDGLHAALV